MIFFLFFRKQKRNWKKSGRHWEDLHQKIRQFSQIWHHRQYPTVVLFLYSHHLTFWECINTVRRNCLLLVLENWNFCTRELSTNGSSTVNFKTKKRKNLTNFVRDKQSTLLLSIFLSPRQTNVFTLAHWLFYQVPINLSFKFN